MNYYIIEGLHRNRKVYATVCVERGYEDMRFSVAYHRGGRFSAGLGRDMTYKRLLRGNCGHIPDYGDNYDNLTVALRWPFRHRPQWAAETDWRIAEAKQWVIEAA